MVSSSQVTISCTGFKSDISGLNKSLIENMFSIIQKDFFMKWLLLICTGKITFQVFRLSHNIQDIQEISQQPVSRCFWSGIAFQDAQAWQDIQLELAEGTGAIDAEQR